MSSGQSELSRRHRTTFCPVLSGLLVAISCDAFSPPQLLCMVRLQGFFDPVFGLEVGYCYRW
jgi:hypothetical protein